MEKSKDEDQKDRAPLHMKQERVDKLREKATKRTGKTITK